jgi:HAD superfamily hydrolase (TIGR01509 family)
MTLRNFVFDIGWVFVDLRPEPLLRLLAARGASHDRLEHVTAAIRLDEHESGRLDGAGLLANLAGLAPQPVSRDELHAAWIDMFELQPQMVALAAHLARQHRVYLLSNVGDLHWAHLTRVFGLDRIGHGALPSFRAGIMKPDPGIYAEAERRFGLEPAATVFIDDRADNIAAARARGWHGVVHQDHASTVAQLEALGVRTH